MDCSPQNLVRLLERQVRRLEGVRRQREAPLHTTGCAALDRLLPAGGLPGGTTVEWLSAKPGSGAGTLALIVASHAMGGGGMLVVMDRQRQFYLPAAAAFGIDLSNTIVVRPQNERDELWALDQSLRCPAVAAVWSPLGKRSSRALRRLQLAVESGGTLGLWLRPTSIRGQPCWSEMQLLVEPRPARGPHRRLRVELVRSRGARPGGVVEVEIDELTGAVREASHRHETHPLHLAPPLARPATRRRSAGA